MRRVVLASAATLALCSLAFAPQATDGPYKVQNRVKVGGEGGSDYIYADPVGRRLYIARGATRAVAATDSAAARPAYGPRVMVYDLETIALVGQVDSTGGNGVAVDPKSGHGFTSSTPASMFDTKTLKLIKKIDLGTGARGDGINFDAFNDRVYIGSHPTKDLTVIDSKDGTVLGTVALDGTPEQAVSDGKGTIYVVLQEAQGSVAVVDVKTMKTTAHYPFGENGGCNGLAIDVKNQILFAACARNAPAAPAGEPQPTQQPMMVILSAKDGKIITKLPLAGSSDGAAFNPATMEAFSTHGNGTMTIIKEKSPTSFEVEQNLQTMNGARTIAFDSKTGRLFAMAAEQGPPAPAPAGGGGRGGRGAAIPGSFTVVVVGK